MRSYGGLLEPRGSILTPLKSTFNAEHFMRRLSWDASLYHFVSITASDRQTDRDRQTGRHRDTLQPGPMVHTDRQTDRQRHRHAEIDRDTDTEPNRRTQQYTVQQGRVVQLGPGLVSLILVSKILTKLLG